MREPAVKLLDGVREKMRLHHEAWATEQSYIAWIERFIVFHKRSSEWQHPYEMGTSEIEEFLKHLAVNRHVSAST